MPPMGDVYDRPRPNEESGVLAQPGQQPGEGPVLPDPPEAAPQLPPEEPLGDDLAPFESRYSPEFAHKIAGLESTDKYEKYHTNVEGEIDAWGKYPLRCPALIDAGLMDKECKWTGLWGIDSDKDFFDNKNNVQDWAFEEFLDDMRGYTKVEGNLDFVGQVNQRRINDGLPYPVRSPMAGVM